MNLFIGKTSENKWYIVENFGSSLDVIFWKRERLATALLRWYLLLVFTLYSWTTLKMFLVSLS